jgi:hypothetical protein
LPAADLERYSLQLVAQNALALKLFSQQLVVRALAGAPLISAGLQMLYGAEVDDQAASSISCTGLAKT